MEGSKEQQGNVSEVGLRCQEGAEAAPRAVTGLVTVTSVCGIGLAAGRSGVTATRAPLSNARRKD